VLAGRKPFLDLPGVGQRLGLISAGDPDLGPPGVLVPLICRCDTL
jgi:hypothetical protein